MYSAHNVLLPPPLQEGGRVNVDAQTFLRLVEASKTLVFVDIESTGLHGDYNSILCVSFKPFGEDPFTYAVPGVGADKGVVQRTKEILEKADCWVSYYGKGFDIPMINTRLFRWGLAPLVKKPHLDLYWQLKSSFNTSRRSQGHLLNWMQLPEEKMSVSASIWAEMGQNFKEKMSVMKKRCESDVTGLEALYKQTRHLPVEIKK